MKMTIPYNVTGKARKRLAEDVSTALNTIPRYLGTPTMSYQIGDCLLDRSGTLTIPDTVDNHTAQTLLAYLAEHGYEGVAEETADKLTISMPRDTLDDAQLTVLRQIVTGSRSSNGPFSPKICPLMRQTSKSTSPGSPLPKTQTRSKPTPSLLPNCAVWPSGRSV